MTLILESLALSGGSHGSEFSGKACLVEAANRIAAGEIIVPDWSPRCPLAPVDFADDHPSISRVIRAFAIGLNDAWNDEDRQRLKPYATRILCTATNDADENTRAWMAIDWLVRVHAPAFLRLAGLEDRARELESLARITDATLAKAAQPTIDAAAKQAEAVRNTAMTPPGSDDAWDAAWDATDAATYASAREAANDAAMTPPGNDAARYAAGDAAIEAAWSAADVAARAAAGAAAGDTARTAAWAALQPSVRQLQDLALELLDAMIAVGQPESQP